MTDKGLKNQLTFTVSHKDPETGELYEGQFTTKRLSIGDRGRLGVRKAQLCSGMHCVRDDNGAATGQGIDEQTDQLNGMIAHLEIALIQKPTWFDLNQITDVTLVEAVYNRVVEHELSFKSGRGSQGVGPDSVRAPGGGSERAGTGSPNSPTPVVGQEVSASLDA